MLVMDIAHGQESALDLIVSEDMAGKSLWEVFKESIIGSDHILQYWNRGADNRKKITYLWKLSNVDWNKFKIECSNID